MIRETSAPCWSSAANRLLRQPEAGAHRRESRGRIRRCSGQRLRRSQLPHHSSCRGASGAWRSQGCISVGLSPGTPPATARWTPAASTLPPNRDAEKWIEKETLFPLRSRIDKKKGATFLDLLKGVEEGLLVLPLEDLKNKVCQPTKVADAPKAWTEDQVGTLPR